MSIKIGDIDIANELLELHFQNFRTLLLLENITNKNPSITPPSTDELESIENRAIEMLQQKFPNMGIKKK